LTKDDKKCQLREKIIFLATGNFHKFDESRRILSEYGISVAMLRVKNVEIQSESLMEIAAASAIDAFDRCRLPLIVEDAGLFVDALKGFPGPYAAYVYRTISNPGLLKLMENVKDRKATFRSVIVYYDGKSEPLVFDGQADGRIAHDETWGKLNTGFGFDPIFQPIGSEKTFAEMTIAEKNGFSHRATAVRKFAQWYSRKSHVYEENNSSYLY
jgi:XTP/dITP diphosphohydrolase